MVIFLLIIIVNILVCRIYIEFNMFYIKQNINNSDRTSGFNVKFRFIKNPDKPIIADTLKHNGYSCMPSMSICHKVKILMP